MAMLFPHLPFRDDETPLSWATRLAALHTRGRVIPFLSDMEIRHTKLLNGHAAAIDRLCSVAGQDPLPVRNNAATLNAKRIFTLRGETMPAGLLLREVTHFCPLCLAEDDDQANGSPALLRRGRLSWTLRIVTTCPVHKCPLVSRKRNCWDDVTHELALLVPETGQALRSLTGSAVRRAPSPLQSYVLNRLEGRRGQAWLDEQSLEQAIKATEILGLVMRFGANVKLGSIGQDGWEIAAHCGWSWSSRGEAGIREALASLQKMAFVSGKGGQNYGAVFGHLYRWLAYSGERSDHGPIKDIVRDYILCNMDVFEGANLLGKPVKRRVKCSVRSLALENNLNHQTLKNVLVARGSIAEGLVEKSSAILLVDAKDGLRVVSAMSRSVHFTKLPKILNATRSITTCLIDLGLLKPLHLGNGRNGRFSCSVDARIVETLMRRLDSHVPEMAPLPSHWVTLTQCTKRARVTMENLLRLIFNGRVKGVGRAPATNGFASVRIDLSEIRLLSR